MDTHIQETVGTYNAIASSYSQNIANLFPKQEADKFLSLLQSGSYILDVGCAAGRDARIFTELGFKVTGIDLSEKLLEIARKENPALDFQYMDMRSTTFANETFDAIWANAVLHHLKEPEFKITIQEWGRICKPGGILYIATKMGERTVTTTESFASNEKRTFTLISKEKLNNFCVSAGFEQIDLYSYNEKEKNPQGREDVTWLVGFFKKVSFS